MRDGSPAVTGSEGTGVRPRGQRDLRLDFFRGLALFFIFIDHTDYNVVTYFTLQGLAFCDAAEIFIFISGMAAAMAYGSVLERSGMLQATARIYRRVWQIYVAHIFVFVAQAALITYAIAMIHTAGVAAGRPENAFFQHPRIAIEQLLVLGFQPGYFSILPLYMFLLAMFPPILLLLRWRPLETFVLSAACYLAAHQFGWALYTYPDHQPWGFNPFTYQFLFVSGAVCGHLLFHRRQVLPRRWWLHAAAGAVVAACGVISISHSIHSIYESFPLIVPDAPWHSVVEKRDLSPLRLINFFALAILAGGMVRRDAAFLKKPVAWPVVLCGQNSLPVFCLGILLSTAGGFVLHYVSDRLRMQVLVTVGGIGLMIALAYLITWYKQMGRAGASVPVRVLAE